MKNRIRIRIKVKSGIQIRIKVMRIQNSESKKHAWFELRNPDRIKVIKRHEPTNGADRFVQNAPK